MSDDALASFRDRLRAGPDPALAADLEAAVRARRDVRSGHGDWALLAEAAGLPALAFREFQLALRDDARDARSAFRLAHYYREHGDSPRALDLLERLLTAEPARDDYLTLYSELLHEDGATPRLRTALDRAVQAGLPAERARHLLRAAAPEPPDEALPDDQAYAAGDADCARFQTLFAGREDLHARQWARPGGEAGYSPIHEPFTAAVARNHLLGTYTVGIYPIRLDGTCTFFALDLDINKAALERARAEPAFARGLRTTLAAAADRLLAVLRDLGLRPLFENSGYKGRHYWVFLEQPESADVLHTLGRLFLAWQAPQLPPELHLEFFPKQGTRRGKGLGNLIKLPLGIHRHTGRRSLLLDDAGQPLARPLEALRHVPRLPRTTLYALIERLKAQPVPPSPAGEPASLAAPPPGPPPPAPLPAWTEADFDTDPRFRHLLAHCPVLAELKRTVDEHRRLSHEEQLVLIHTLGHVEGGPLAVNYLLGKCADVGPEKLLKDRLKGNPVSCPSIRKKIGHITRRVPCNCPFDFAPDRYPTPVLHLLTLPAAAVPAPAAADLETLARRYAALVARQEEIRREADQVRGQLIAALRAQPERAVACPGGRYRLVEREGIEELTWESERSE